MSRYTSAYSSFLSRLDEVEVLRKIAARIEKTDPFNSGYQISALCRGSVVLLSGNLETYVKELGELALDSLFSKSIKRDGLYSRFYYHISKSKLNELRDTSDPSKIGDKIFEFLSTDLVYWSRNGPFSQSIPAERFNKGFASPSFKKIKSYLNRFGCSRYQDDLATRLGSAYLPTINMIDHLVDTRNRIAHGDPTATKTPSDIKNMVTIVKMYCAETDGAFATWWKNEFCSIR